MPTVLVHTVSLVLSDRYPGWSSPLGEDRVARPAKPLPRLKVEANISNIRVAIVEDVDDPQALTLKVYTCMCGTVLVSLCMCTG